MRKLFFCIKVILMSFIEKCVQWLYKLLELCPRSRHLSHDCNFLYSIIVYFKVIFVTCVGKRITDFFKRDKHTKQPIQPELVVEANGYRFSNVKVSHLNQSLISTPSGDSG